MGDVGVLLSEPSGVRRVSSLRGTMVCEKPKAQKAQVSGRSPKISEMSASKGSEMVWESGKPKISEMVWAKPKKAQKLSRSTSEMVSGVQKWSGRSPTKLRNGLGKGKRLRNGLGGATFFGYLKYWGAAVA